MMSFWIMINEKIHPISEIFKAIQKGNIKKLVTLLDDRKEKNPILDEFEGEGSTVLHLAAGLGHLELIKWYKDALNFSNINPEDNKGNTPFSLAIGEEKLDVVAVSILTNFNMNQTL